MLMGKNKFPLLLYLALTTSRVGVKLSYVTISPIDVFVSKMLHIKR